MVGQQIVSVIAILYYMYLKEPGHYVLNHQAWVTLADFRYSAQVLWFYCSQILDVKRT